MAVLGLAGCVIEWPIAGIGVLNQTDEAYLLRVEGISVWDVPPHSEGIGPTDLEPGGKQVEILRSDCTLWASWGLHDARTIVIRSSSPGDVSLEEGLETESKLTPTSLCERE